MTQHLTRKDMKRDDFATAVGRGMEYAESHARTFLIGLGVVALLAVLFLVGRIFLGSRADQANEALSHALKIYQAPIDATAAKPDDPKTPSFPDAEARRTRAKKLFEGVRNDYGMSDAADVAGLYLAQIAAEEGKLDQARELWNAFVDDNPKNILAGEARVNLIHLDRQQGKGQDLVQRLKTMLEEEEPGLPKDVILYELATTQDELGRKQEALSSWRRITEEYPESAYRSEAQQKVAALDPTAGAAGMPGLGGFPR
jgi:tetratricopeptide (TPR) repeat protein